MKLMKFLLVFFILSMILMICFPSLITEIMVAVIGTAYGSYAGYVIVKGMNEERKRIVKELQKPLKNEVNQ